MAIKLSDSIRVGQQKPLEDKYFNGLVPYISTSQVNTLLPKPVRHIGLTVNINKEEYWYKDGIEDANLVLKITNSDIYDLKNQEQDDRLENLEGINYVWSPTNRRLTLYDRKGTQVSQVSLVSLDNEGTDLRYNASTLSLELYNTNNGDDVLLDSIPISSFVYSVGAQLQLNSNQLQLKDGQGNILSTVTFEVDNISGLQTALDGKQDRLQSATGNIGVGKSDVSATEKLDVNGNVKSNSYKFNLPSSVSSQPNMLIPKTDGTRPIWYNNSSVANELAFKSDIDNLQIGGRNLMLNSKGEIAAFHFPVTTSEPLIEGCEYTLSADVFGTLLGHVFINNSITSPIRESNFNSTTNYRRVSVTFTFVKNDYLGCEIYPHFYSGDKVKNIKLEKGNIATDWEPNPEDKQDRLQNISGSIGIGKPDASATEKLDVNGNIKATGFKLPSGTANQSLTANGGVFDLTAKADLEGVKYQKLNHSLLQ